MSNNAMGMHALTNLSSQMKTVNRQFANGIRKNLRTAIGQQGAVVVSAIRARATWSSRIPGAVGLSIRYNQRGASVRVQVDHNRAPHARPLEVGNKDGFDEGEITSRLNSGTARNRRQAIAQGRRTSPGFVTGRVLRHPVYHATSDPGGYAEMSTRPFFKAGIDASAPGIDIAMERVVIQTAHDAGFK